MRVKAAATSGCVAAAWAATSSALRLQHVVLLQRIAIQEQIGFILVFNPRTRPEGLRQSLLRRGADVRRLGHSDAQFVLLDKVR